MDKNINILIVEDSKNDALLPIETLAKEASCES